MAEAKGSQSVSTLSNRPSSSGSPPSLSARRQTSISLGAISAGSQSSLSIHSSYSDTSPRVQLVPHIHRHSYDSSLSQVERDVLDSTSFDAFDLSSKDFDFEDIFTYDKPQRKLASVIEVSSASKERDWSSFSFSHHPAAIGMRQKVNRGRTGKGELYVKNKGDARKR